MPIINKSHGEWGQRTTAHFSIWCMPLWDRGWLLWLQHKQVSLWRKLLVTEYSGESRGKRPQTSWSNLINIALSVKILKTCDQCTCLMSLCSTNHNMHWSALLYSLLNGSVIRLSTVVCEEFWAQLMLKWQSTLNEMFSKKKGSNS